MTGHLEIQHFIYSDSSKPYNMPQSSKYCNTYFKYEETEIGRLIFLAEVTQLSSG